MKKRYAVDIHWDVAKCMEVDARSREEAERIVSGWIARGDISVWTDAFEATDDVTVECHGEENADGEIEYD